MNDPELIELILLLSSKTQLQVLLPEKQGAEEQFVKSRGKWNLSGQLGFPEIKKMYQFGDTENTITVQQSKFTHLEKFLNERFNSNIIF